VSLKQTSICVVDERGSVLREGVVISDPEAIAAFVRLNAPGAARIGLETGPTTTWLWTELKRLDLPVICIDARHAKAVLKMQINKSDRNYAAGIARITQTGWFKEVRVKDIESPDFLCTPEKATALATLIRQRRLTPSCGGHAPTAERTVGPARMIVDSLTPRPGIREHYRHVKDSRLSQPIDTDEHNIWPL